MYSGSGLSYPSSYRCSKSSICSAHHSLVASRPKDDVWCKESDYTVVEVEAGIAVGVSCGAGFLLMVWDSVGLIAEGFNG